MRRFWGDRYQEALELAQDEIDRSRFIICGYTINIDLVIPVEASHIEKLAQGREIDILKAMDNPKGRIETPIDFLSGLLYLMDKGRGGEWMVENEEVSHWLSEHFQGGRKVGGTGAQAACALAKLGIPTILHITSFPPEQAELLPGEGKIMIPYPQGLQRAEEAARRDDLLMWHYIFEFRQGTKIDLGTKVIITKKDDRFIVPYDLANANFTIDENFRKWTREYADQVDKAIVSGYNALYDEEMCHNRIVDSVAQIRDWKDRNPKMLVHAETAGLENIKMRRYLIEELYPNVDSLGMNENELVDILILFDYDILSNNVKELYEAARFIYRELKLKRLCVHTRDFAFTLTQGDPEREQRALLIGALSAAYRAITGEYGDWDDLRGVNERSSLNYLGEKVGGELSSLLNLKEGIVEEEDFNTVLAVTKSVEQPQYTVGLGDTFLAGTLAVL
jgi:ADP-dependent phosphofructokinase/glucokinase